MQEGAEKLSESKDASAVLSSLVTNKEARILVHVIHFPFNGMGDATRTCDEKDLKNLKGTFACYKNCTFIDLESPSRDEIFSSLQSEGTRDLIKNSKDCDGSVLPPTIYILIILSHGKENGIIFTDKSDGSSFTTQEVTENLRINSFLKDAFKIIFFGPCKGDAFEKRSSAPPVRHDDASVASIKLLATPNEENFAIFYSTMESTFAITRPEKGSQMVISLCETLKTLERDVDVLELFRKIKEKITFRGNGVYQMPQSYVYPHDKTIFFSRSATVDASGNTSKVIPADRADFHYWAEKSRGHALVFGAVSDQNEQLVVSRKLERLDYKTVCKDISEMEITLENVSLNLEVTREGSLLVVAVCELSVVNYREEPEWAIECGRGKLPIGVIMRKFIATSCPALANNPKMFFFVDPRIIRKDKVTLPDDVSSTWDEPDSLNHENFFALVCHGEEAVGRLIDALEQLRRNEKNNLQGVMVPFINSSWRGKNTSFAWSTMTKLLDFPEESDKYCPHSIICGEGQSQTRLTFEEFKTRQANMELGIRPHLVIVHGLGLTRFAEELHSHLVFEVKASVVLFRLSQHRDLWRSRETKIDLLQKINSNRRKVCNPAQERLILVVDEWSNLTSDQQKIASECLENLVQQHRVQMIVTINTCDKEKINITCTGSETIELDLANEEILSRLREKLEMKIKRRESENNAATEVCFSDDFHHSQTFTLIHRSREGTDSPSFRKEEILKTYENVEVFAEHIADCVSSSGFVLSCPPGMGKTKNMQLIYKALQRKRGDFRIIHLDLRKHVHEINNLKNKPISRAEVFGFIKEATKSQLDKEKVETRKVIILLDAYDEICPRHRKVAIALLSQLKEMNLKTVVATRPQEERAILEALGVQINTIYVLNLITKIEWSQFIAGAWRDPKKEKIAKRLIEDVARYKWYFQGTPQDLLMLAKMFPDGNLNEDMITNSDMYASTIALYIKSTIHKFHAHSSNRNEDDDSKDFAFGYNRAQQLAVDNIVREKITAATEDDKKLYIDRYPFFVTKTDTNQLEFTHKTFAEYLVAVQVVKLLNDYDYNEQECFINYQDCIKILTDPNLDTIRGFVDRILSYTKVKSLHSAKKVFKKSSGRVGYICIRELHLNIFKTFHRNEAIPNSFFNKQIHDGFSGKIHPLEMLIKNAVFRPHDCNEFVEFLLTSGSRLEKCVNDLNCDDLLEHAIKSKLNGLVKNHWKTIFLGRMNLDLRYPLFYAVSFGNRDMAQFLIENGAAYWATEKVKSFLQSVLSCEDSEHIVNMIMETMRDTSKINRTHKRSFNITFLETYEKVKSVDITALDGHDSPLPFATRKNLSDLVKILLQAGADPNKKYEGDTCLDRAVDGGALECFVILFEVTKEEFKDVNRLLLRAASTGQIEIFNHLIILGADATTVDGEGNTCIHKAAKSSQVSSECFELLLKNYADKLDIDKPNNYGETPLLIAAGMNWDSDVRKVTLLLEQGADACAKDNVGNTPLHNSIRFGRFSCFKTFLFHLRNKEEINGKTSDGKTPLILAAERCFGDANDVIKLLLQNGADPMVKDPIGDNSLHIAARKLAVDRVELFLDLGLAVDSRNRDGSTPLMLVSGQFGPAPDHESSVAELLISRGADVNSQDDNGWTSLHHAAAMNCRNVIKVLCSHGSHLECKNRDGKTALQLAVERGHKYFARDLEKKAAEGTEPEDTAATAPNPTGNRVSATERARNIFGCAPS